MQQRFANRMNTFAGTMTAAPPRLELNDRGADARHQNLARSQSGTLARV